MKYILFGIVCPLLYFALFGRAVVSSFKPGGPMVESKPQMKHFIAAALDFFQNTLTTALY